MHSSRGTRFLAIISHPYNRYRTLTSDSLPFSDPPERPSLHLPLESPRVPDLLMALENDYADGRVNTADGLRVDWPGRWFHVRVSQTEPVVRVICEQRDHPPTALFDALIDRVRRMA